MKFAIPPDWPVEGRGTYVDAKKPEQSYSYESFPDALPRFGFQVTRIPVGKLDIDLTAILWFPVTVGAAGPERFIEAMNQTGAWHPVPILITATEPGGPVDHDFFVEAVGAGVDEIVLYASGSSARQTVATDKRPCDAVVMAIVDSWEVGGKERYKK